MAGSSLAHAEVNALGKLRFRKHEDDGLELHTTLQPCLQCLGAIRLLPVRHVDILAPDPLWIGVERLRNTTAFVAARWPSIWTLPASEWAVLALLSPTRAALGHQVLAEAWRRALPTTSELSEATQLGNLSQGTVVDVVAPWWHDLATCVAEVERLAADARAHQQ